MKQLFAILFSLLFVANITFAVYEVNEEWKITKLRFSETKQMDLWRSHHIMNITLFPEADNFEHIVIRVYPKDDLKVPGELFAAFELETQQFWGQIQFTYIFQKRALNSLDLDISKLFLYQQVRKEWKQIQPVQITFEDADNYYFVFTTEAVPDTYFALCTEPEKTVETPVVENISATNNTITGQATNVVVQTSDDGFGTTILFLVIGALVAGICVMTAYYFVVQKNKDTFKPAI